MSNVYCDRCLDLVKEHRSKKSHDHFHAHLDEAWKQLPHGISELYPSVDHLRKRALIDAGYYDEEIIDCGTNEAAIRVAALVSRKDNFVLVIIHDRIVIIRTAKSQSYKAMGKKVFQQSKDAVLDIAWALCGTTPQEASPHVAT